jgi:hypothetical protein
LIASLCSPSGVSKHATVTAIDERITSSYPSQTQANGSHFFLVSSLSILLTPFPFLDRNPIDL